MSAWCSYPPSLASRVHNSFNRRCVFRCVSRRVFCFPG
jgi:hypothetical protein